jgi:hypothetical protein
VKKEEKNNLQTRLEKELQRLKSKAKIGHELSVVWLPNHNTKLSGEVKNGNIYIYEDIEDKAIETLRHEFMDYLISKVVEPYKLVANKLVELLNEEAYRKKEEVADALTLLLFEESGKRE